MEAFYRAKKLKTNLSNIKKLSNNDIKARMFE